MGKPVDGYMTDRGRLRWGRWGTGGYRAASLREETSDNFSTKSFGPLQSPPDYLKLSLSTITNQSPEVTAEELETD